MTPTQIRLPRFKSIDHAIRKLEQQMQGATSEETRVNLQRRLDALTARQDSIARRPLIDRDLDILALILCYRFIPTSLIVRLIPGPASRLQDRLQLLWLKGLVKRFQTARNVGEFNYYIDRDETLHLLAARRGLLPDALPGEEVRTNRTARYEAAAQQGDSEKLLFLKHELMISRFHAMLELAALHFPNLFRLLAWRQGSKLWQTIEAPTLLFDRDLQQWRNQAEETEALPHRPDAFFTIACYDETSTEWIERSFFYEADRDTMPLPKMRRKFRAHFHYCVVHKKYREHYEVPRIRAVLIEARTTARAESLLAAAGHPIVSGQPSPLFWVTSSERFEALLEVEEGKTIKRTRLLPKFLRDPGIILKPIWLSPKDHREQVRYALLEK